MSPARLPFSDRSEISTASTAGWSVRKSARHLGNCPSVTSREIRRNSTKTRGYQAVSADVVAAMAGSPAPEPPVSVRAFYAPKTG